MRRHRSPHVSQVTRVDDEGNGRADFVCHMWMRERPPHSSEVKSTPVTSSQVKLVQGRSSSVRSGHDAA
jgi:hypothetical protein